MDLFQIIDELSKSNPPVSNCIVIDAKDKISESKQKQNDGYNKKAVFSMFNLYGYRQGKMTTLDDSVFDEFEEKDEKYIKLKNVISHLFVLKTNPLEHYLISTENKFKQFVNMKHIQRLFTFIEYNEDYLHKHIKNYVFNCDQIASVLFPYIWEQLSFEIRIELINFIKIIVLHKLTNEGISNEHRFLIIYDDHGILRHYLVDDKLKFKTKVKFNFMEENLFCKSLTEFEIIGEIVEDPITKERKEIKCSSLKLIDDQINNVLNCYVLKIIHSFCNNAKFEKPKTFKIEHNNSKLEFNFDFDFNKVITSDNINELFDYLRIFNCFDIIDGKMMRIDGSKTHKIHKNNYESKIMAHFVKDFTDESLNDLDLRTLSCIIEPDTIIVTIRR